jgi:hypothetical protein
MVPPQWLAAPGSESRMKGFRSGFKTIRVASPIIVERGKEDGPFGAEAWP